MSRRLVPFLFVLFVACYLDRVNVGFAALQMNRALGLSATAYGLGAGVFFVGYCLFEVPSNVILARIGARRWIARIMISWGLLSAAMLFARGPASFYSLRFLLGVAEAGFFPGIVYYLGVWFPGEWRGRVNARFMIALPLSGVIGGPVSGALLALGGRFGLAGWQWLFLIEGIPSVILGVVTLHYLTDRPEDAQWLRAEERQWLVDRLRDERERCFARHPLSVRQALAHRAVWQLALLQGLAINAGLYALSFWLPQIVKGFSGLSDLRVGVATALPYVIATVAMIMVGTHSDRTNERWIHVALCCVASSLGFLVSAFAGSPAVALVALSVAASGIMSTTGPFWALPATFLTGGAAAAGIALINSAANVMGFAVPYAVGLLKDATGDYRLGLALLAALPLSGAAMAFRLGRTPTFTDRLRSTRAGVVPLLVVALLCPWTSLRAQSVDTAIRQLEQAWALASLHGDTAAFNRLMAPDYRAVRTDGVIEHREGRLRAFGSGVVRTVALDLSELSVRVVDTATAIVTGLATRSDSSSGRPRDFQYRYLRVWQRRGGQWQVVEFQTTTVAPGQLGGLRSTAPAEGQSAGSAAGLRDEVLAAEHRRHDALLHGDADALARILADDFVEVGPAGGRSKATNVGDERAGRVHWTQLTVRDEAVTIFDPTTAAVTGVLDGGGTYDGHLFTRHLRILRIYSKRDGRWQNVAAANAPLPQ